MNATVSGTMSFAKPDPMTDSQLALVPKQTEDELIEEAEIGLAVYRGRRKKNYTPTRYSPDVDMMKVRCAELQAEWDRLNHYSPFEVAPTVRKAVKSLEAAGKSDELAPTVDAFVAFEEAADAIGYRLTMMEIIKEKAKKLGYDLTQADRRAKLAAIRREMDTWDV